jgi:hypothetical protein
MTSDRTRLAWALAVAGTITRASSVSAQSAEDEARRHYRAGAEMVRNGNCRGALAEFRQSITLVDSPNTRLLYARCLTETGDLVGALDEYDHTERDAARRAGQESRYAATRDAAHDEGAQIAARLGRLVIVVSPGASPSSIRIGEREIRLTEFPNGVPVSPGAVHVVATFAGTSRSFDANVSAGGRTELRLEPNAAEPVANAATSNPEPAVEAVPPTTETPPPSGGAPAWLPFAIGGLGVAGLAVGGGLYGGAWSAYTANMNSCHMACTDTQLAGGRGMEIGAYVSFGVGAALVAGGVIAFIVLRRAPSSVRAHLEPAGSGITVRF